MVLTMQRTVVNPWHWSVEMGFNQGEVVEGATRVLFCAGQTAVDETACPSTWATWVRRSRFALDNLEAVLGEADMGLANLVRMNIYTTDVDAFFAVYESAAARDSVPPVSPRPARCWGWRASRSPS